MLVPTPSLLDELRSAGFGNLALWPRGVDAPRFSPGPRDALEALGLPRPVFLYVGRVAAEKNLPAFLATDLPGSKVVVGDGPALPGLRARFAKAHFLGARDHCELPALYRAADVFVFPSRTDTFGLVVLEALASGLPVAAYPVQGPNDMAANYVIQRARTGENTDELASTAGLEHCSMAALGDAFRICQVCVFLGSASIAEPLKLSRFRLKIPVRFRA